MQKAGSFLVLEEDDLKELFAGGEVLVPEGCTKLMLRAWVLDDFKLVKKPQKKMKKVL